MTAPTTPAARHCPTQTTCVTARSAWRGKDATRVRYVYGALDRIGCIVGSDASVSVYRPVKQQPHIQPFQPT